MSSGAGELKLEPQASSEELARSPAVYGSTDRLVKSRIAPGEHENGSVTQAKHSL